MAKKHNPALYHKSHAPLGKKALERMRAKYAKKTMPELEAELSVSPGIIRRAASGGNLRTAVREHLTQVLGCA